VSAAIQMSAPPTPARVPYDGAKRFEKRAFDISFSLLVLAAALPVLLVAALAVKLTSKGPDGSST
jgi:lipopolysaccharide/colanic/teichoic acid biosynthesis glycosyltransferase